MKLSKHALLYAWTLLLLLSSLVRQAAERHGIAIDASWQKTEEQ